MIHAAAFAPVAALFAAPAFADFGAIAVSAATGGYGLGAGEDRAGAERSALEECGGYGRDCAVTLAFAAGCGALARSDASSASATGETLVRAEARALDACMKLNAAGCEIEVSFCSRR